MKQNSELGQFWTPPHIANVMAEWVRNGKPDTVMDPSCGNGSLLKPFQDCQRYGYEIDSRYSILGVTTYHQDFMTSEIRMYDAIVSNPPYIKYNKIQGDINEYHEILKNLTNTTFSKNMNLYAMFVIKSWFYLKPGGYAAYLIPSEWSNANFGDKIKSFLKNTCGLKHVIYFDNNILVFPDNLSTGCILLMKKDNMQTDVNFCYISQINNSYQDTHGVSLQDYLSKGNLISWKRLLKYKWNSLQYNDVGNNDTLSKVITTKRGITTGDNAFFLINESTRKKYNIPLECLCPCIGKATYVKENHIDMTIWNQLKKQDKPCWLLDIHDDCHNIDDYLQYGIDNGVDRKYITSHRKVWYGMEAQAPSPIWCSVFYRDRPKFIYNPDGLKTLTCFHNIYIKDGCDINLIYDYLNSSICMNAIKTVQRVYGNGLLKLEPKDILNIPWKI